MQTPKYNSRTSQTKIYQTSPMVLSKPLYTFQSSPVQTVALSMDDGVTIQQHLAKDFNVSEGFQKKRKAEDASVLDASVKMAMVISRMHEDSNTSIASIEEDFDESLSSTRRSKRARMERLCLLKQRISVFEALTSALAEVTRNKDPSRFDSDPGCHLHHACELVAENKEYIKKAVDCAPYEVSCRSTKFATTGLYSLPLNIALNNKQASIGVIKIILDADPSISALKDGHDGSASLNIALIKRSCDFRIVKLLLQAHPDCIRVADNSLNLPLHVACACGGSATLELIKHLYTIYPDACFKRNIHGELPLHVAERNPLCPKSIVNFLRRTSEETS